MQELDFIKRRKKEILLFFAAILITFITSKILLRIFLPSYNFPDKKLGWAVRNPHKEYLIINDETGKYRNVSIIHFEHGFKRCGQLNTSKKKVLIIGDSFTEMKFVSNGEEWYSYLEKEFENIELFVYGTGGFGTLQEYMIIDEYIDIIKPDLILWQFYFNDFINNHYEFDKGEWPLNNHGFRPYLENGKIVYRISVPCESLRKSSKILELLFNVYDIIKKQQANKNQLEFYQRIYGKEFWNKDFTEAAIFNGKFNETLNITIEIFKIAKIRANNTPIFLFSVDSRLEEAEIIMTSKNNITYIQGLSQYIQAKKEKGIETFVINDGHWNLAGNSFAGEFLARYFKEAKVLD